MGAGNPIQGIVPSKPGYDFTTADLAQARISPEEISRILLQAVQDGNTDSVIPLLAEIAKGQDKINSMYNSLGVSLPMYHQIQICGFNPLRNYLLIQNPGGGDMFIVFEAGPPQIADFSVTLNDQAQLINKQPRALRIVAGGNFEPLKAPKNPLVLFTLNAATVGVVVEGVY